VCVDALPPATPVPPAFPPATTELSAVWLGVWKVDVELSQESSVELEDVI
jgi:hypothetical protein